MSKLLSVINPWRGGGQLCCLSAPVSESFNETEDPTFKLLSVDTDD